MRLFHQDLRTDKIHHFLGHHVLRFQGTYFHKSSLLPILPCPNFRVSDPDFMVCSQHQFFHLTKLHCPTLHKSSHLPVFPRPDFKVCDLDFRTHDLKFICQISGCLILISGFIICTKPPSLLYYLAPISRCLILILEYILRN